MRECGSGHEGMTAYDCEGSGSFAQLEVYRDGANREGKGHHLAASYAGMLEKRVVEGQQAEHHERESSFAGQMLNDEMRGHEQEETGSDGCETELDDAEADYRLPAGLNEKEYGRGPVCLVADSVIFPLNHRHVAPVNQGIRWAREFSLVRVGLPGEGGAD